MDVKVFRTFLEVARVRHFGRAAENLYLTQAAVSARIKQLEGYFDTQLFIRDRNNIKLTSSGERLIGYAEVMVSTLQQAKFELSLESGKALQLTLGGTPNIWDAYLQNCLSVVTDSFGGYGFMAEVMGREQLNRNLLERTLDMAFAFDQIKAEELNCKKVADLVLVLVSTQPDDLESVFQHKYVYVDWGTRFGSEHAERHPKVPAPYLRTSTARIALDFILEKGGSAYLPVSLVEPFIESGQLHKVKGVEDWYRPIYLSYRKNSTSVDAIMQVEKLVNEIDPSTAYTLQQAAEQAPE
ncbi:Transcriptional regulator, LysR family [Vibrio chagasii]|uniref:LysR family transcriptional regulator n=1 Tax=Vibrio TaxID=662 RepID=UPI000152FACC|nr:MULTISPECIES: LysR family transcriptional regulator [Vibrio]EDK30464.1 transcriptional regulator, LysR family protein [Vibrionales bacterium SWAT-3]MDE9380897.1 LysR family transcriptional regulator [Vibrio alginolyticus]MBJ2146385.1 LysR family transcriptional regulator [Vibrio sp. IB15]MCG9562122.1 LysR family transcriptional regulator [Vibrio chagasii]MCG9566018.1 LysR family transcriptional regulator [Vibrio chagasii]